MTRRAAGSLFALTRRTAALMELRHLGAVVPGSHRGDARDDLSSRETSNLGALLWATELSGSVLGPIALVSRLRLGRQAAADPLALAVRQAFPLPAGALRFGSPGPNY